MKRIITVAVFTVLFCANGFAVDVKVKGTLRAPACTLHPDDRDIDIDLSTTGSRDLYLGTTADKEFKLRLHKCDIGYLTFVDITFDGTRNLTVPGALAIDAGSKASGFAIVIKDSSHQPVALGNVIREPLTAADVNLTFYTNLVIEPDARDNTGVVPGTFTASGTFTLAYP
ncbi:fimbrial protein [Enterobacter cloacae]|uniref:fimbrial protein n=1 Tax=Enterobacter cloacae TaxID=550 RepID=UPI00101B2150|nr:fimbrial protein [Enterobacter cloacae]QBC03384.1 type 1 fimbrial protein [Enterobacter cloacae]